MMRSSYLVTRFRLARWRSHATQLWARYRAVACLDDQHEVYLRLSAFLHSFRAYYSEVTACEGSMRDESANLDRLFGECTDILHELLDYIERCTGGKKPAAEAEAPATADAKPDAVVAEPAESGQPAVSSTRASAAPNLVELIPEVLNALELILREERYVDTIRSSPQILGRILSMLERLQTSESRQNLLAIISRLGSSRWARQEIGRLQGFSRMLRLATQRDETLSRVILRTAQALLGQAQLASVGNTTDWSMQPPSGGGGRVGALVAELSTLVMPEVMLARLRQWISSSSDQAPLDADAAVDAEGVTSAPAADGVDASLPAGPLRPPAKLPGCVCWPPQADELSQATAWLEEARTCEPESAPLLDGGGGGGEGGGEGAGAEALAGDELALVQDVMRVQGALRSLLAMLADASEHLQLEVIQTIRALLSNNLRNQREFRGLQGYELIARAIDAIPDEQDATPRPAKDTSATAKDCLPPAGSRAPPVHRRLPSDCSGAGDTAYSASSEDTADLAMGGGPGRTSGWPRGAAAVCEADAAEPNGSAAGGVADAAATPLEAPSRMHQLEEGAVPRPHPASLHGKATVLRGIFAVMRAIILDGDVQADGRVGNLDALRVLVGLACTSRRHCVRLGAVRCVRELLLANPTNVVSLLLTTGIGGEALLHSLLHALSECDEPVGTPKPREGEGESFYEELEELALLCAFLLSAQDAALAHLLLSSASLEQTIAAAAAARGHARHWREIRALCEISGDLAARGCLRLPHWQRFGSECVEQCLSALAAVDHACERHAAAGTPLPDEATLLCEWASEMLGVLCTASSALLVHAGDAGVLSLLALLFVHASSLPATDFAPRERRGVEVWEASLWLLQEMGSRLVRVGRFDGVLELSLLTRGCSLRAGTPPPADATYPSSFRLRLAELEATPRWAHAAAVAPRARASVIGALAHMLRAAPRRQAAVIKRHLLSSGGVEALLLLLYASAHDAEERHELAERAVGALAELACGCEAAKQRLHALVGGGHLIALLHAALRAPPPPADARGGRAAMHILFELACSGSFRRVLGLVPPSSELYARSAGLLAFERKTRECWPRFPHPTMAGVLAPPRPAAAAAAESAAERRPRVGGAAPAASPRLEEMASPMPPELLLPEIIPELRSCASTATASPRAGSAVGAPAGSYRGSKALAHLSLQLPGLVRLRLRGDEGVDLIVRFLHVAAPQVQADATALLLLLLESSPCNKRIVCASKGVSPFLRLATRCSDDEGGGMPRIQLLRVAASLGEYTITASDALRLFRFAAMPESYGDLARLRQAAAPKALEGGGGQEKAHDDGEEMRAQHREELQMQVLFVVGCIAERAAPPSFFSFDGDSALSLPALSHFPLAKTGYTLTFWLRIDAVAEGEREVVMLSLVSTSGQRLLEVSLERCLNVDEEISLPVRSLVVRTGPSHAEGCVPPGDAASSSGAAGYKFDAHRFAECGGWHHIVLTHNWVGATLLVDGAPVETAAALAYPDVSAKVARAKSLLPLEPSQFCGQVSTLLVLEGCVERSVASRLYHRGALHADSIHKLRAIGVDGRLLLQASAQPGGPRQRRRRSGFGGGARQSAAKGEAAAHGRSWRMRLHSSSSASVPTVREPSEAPALDDASEDAAASFSGVGGECGGGKGHAEGSVSRAEGAGKAPSEAAGGKGDGRGGETRGGEAGRSFDGRGWLSRRTRERSPSPSRESAAEPTAAPSGAKAGGARGEEARKAEPGVSHSATCEMHCTETMASQLALLCKQGAAAGPAVCLPFVTLGAAQRLAALRILLALLHADDVQCREFCEAHHGFAQLLFLLLAQCSALAVPPTSVKLAPSAEWSCCETLQLLLESVDRGVLSSPPGAPIPLLTDASHPSDGKELRESREHRERESRERSDTAGRPADSPGAMGGLVASSSSAAASAFSSHGGSATPTGGAGVVPPEVSSPAAAATSALSSGKSSWMPARLSTHALQLVFDLLPCSTPRVLRSAIECLHERFAPTGDSNAPVEFVRLWRSVGGLPALLSLALLPCVSRKPHPAEAPEEDLLHQLLGARRGLLGLATASFTAEETEQLLDFATLSDELSASLQSLGPGAFSAVPPPSGTRGAAEGPQEEEPEDGPCVEVQRVRERVAQTIAEVCEASAAGRGAIPSTVHDHLRASSAPAVLALLSLLGEPSESLRISGVRILASLLKLPQPKKDRERDAFATAFAKLQGWELAARALQTQHASSDVCHALLDLAGGEALAAPRGVPQPARSSRGEPAAAALAPEGGRPTYGRMEDESTRSSGVATLQLPNALQLLLEGISRNERAVQLQLLRKLESLVESSRQFDALVDSDWLAWMASLLRVVETNQPEHERLELEQRVLGLVSTVLLHDMTHSTRAACRLGKLAEVQDAEGFQLAVVQALLRHFEMHPGLPMPEATNLLPNICLLFDLVDEIAGTALQLGVACTAELLRTIALVNQLACHNSPTVRSWMKAQSLFESRDALTHELLHMVTELPTSQALQLLANIQQPLPIDANLGVIMLQLLLNESVDVQLRCAAGELLIQHASYSRDAIDKEAKAFRHTLSKALDDAEILARLLPPRDASSPASLSEGASEKELSQEHVAAFVEWYFGADGPSRARREALAARLARQLISSSKAARLAGEKSASKRAKRAKQRAERQSRASAALAKSVADVSERQRFRIARGSRALVRRITATREARAARLARGEREWARAGSGIVSLLLANDEVELQSEVLHPVAGGTEEHEDEPHCASHAPKEEDGGEEEDAAATAEEEEADEEPKPSVDDAAVRQRKRARMRIRGERQSAPGEHEAARHTSCGSAPGSAPRLLYLRRLRTGSRGTESPSLDPDAALRARQEVLDAVSTTAAHASSASGGEEFNEVDDALEAQCESSPSALETNPRRQRRASSYSYIPLPHVPTWRGRRRRTTSDEDPSAEMATDQVEEPAGEDFSAWASAEEEPGTC